MKRIEIRLSGSGGQGLVLAGIILAEAAVRDGLNAVQTQSYGPEARGGASKSEVVLSDLDIDYPKVIYPDILLAMTQEACDRYAADLQRDGILVVDGRMVVKLPAVQARVYRPEITNLAQERLGNRVVANMVALGFIVATTGVVSIDSLKSAVSDRVPRGTQELNLKAVEAGITEAVRWRENEREN